MFFFHKPLLTLLLGCVIKLALAQERDSIRLQQYGDSSTTHLNMDAVYNRPFLISDKMPVAVGGYLEANTLHQTTEGISEGLSFQARRLTIFMSASISRRLKFLMEMEFEDGGSEIGIEFAAMDLSLHPALNIRGGIFMNPIGAFNQNHDGPKWEFIDRPEVAVHLLPATWSNPGFGLYGKAYHGPWIFGYEAYLSNGFDGSIIDNKENKSFLPAVKNKEGRFEESSNGRALFTGKLVVKNRGIGEIGFSYMGGVYNQFQADGILLDKKRRVDVVAIDFNTTIRLLKTRLVGEIVYAHIDVPDTYTQQFGQNQVGMFFDLVQPVVRRPFFDWPNAIFYAAVRVDYVDWNTDALTETGFSIGDQQWSVTPAISFRPTQQTVIRLNYRYTWTRDLLNNPAERTASWLFGFSTYF